MAFDPDAYLAATAPASSGFDPDAYLKSKPPKAKSEPVNYYPADPSIFDTMPNKGKNLADLLTGATGILRGGANLVSDGSGDKIWPPTEGGSGFKTAGSLADPAAWAVGGGIMSAAPKLLSKAATNPGVAKVIEEMSKHWLGRAVGRGATGAAAGGAIGGLSEEGDAGTGATVGAVANTLLPPAFSGVLRGANALKQKVYPTPGALGVRAAGDKADDVINAMMTTKSEVPGVNLTAGQAALSAKSPQFSALQKNVADKYVPEILGSVGVEGEQAAAMRAYLAIGAKGATQEEAILSRIADKKSLSKVVGAQMENELAAANIAGRALPRLQGNADKLGEAASSKVADVRRLSEAQKIAQDVAQSGRGRLGADSQPIGMPRVSGKYSYSDELANLAEREAQKAAGSSLIMGEGSRFSQRQADSLAAHGLHPLDTSKLSSSMNAILDEPSIAGNKMAQTAVRYTEQEIAKWAAKNGGVIDAAALHSIRKNSVNSAVLKFMGGAEKSAQKEHAASLMIKIKPAIDDAIEAAGGTEWRKVLDAFSKGRHEIDKTKMAAKAMDLLDKSPDTLIRLAKGDAPEIVSKVFGPGKVSLSKEMGGAETPIKRVAAELERQKIFEQSASDGMSSLNSRIGTPSAPSQGFLNAWVSMIRSQLNRVLGTGHEKALQRLAPLMKDPEAYAKLMQAATPQQRAVIDSIMAKYATQGAIVGGAQQGEPQ